MGLRSALRKRASRLKAVLPDALLSRLHSGYNIRPMSPEVFDSEHAAGGWDWIGDGRERARYAVVAAYVPPNAAVLDVGCGTGLLQEWLAKCGYSRYLGTDVAGSAITRAQARSDEKTSFTIADADSPPPDGPFDTVVFNESLYYMPDPAETLRRYMSVLTPTGVFVISMWQCRAALRSWRQASSAVIVEDSCTVRRACSTWVIRVCRPAPH